MKNILEFFNNLSSSFMAFIESLKLRHYHLYLLGSVAHMEVCLEAARDGANPNAFWIFWRMDIVHKMYKKIKEQSV